MSIFSKGQIKKVVVNAENHGYKPETVTFKQGKPAQIKFIPSENMGCMDQIVFKDLGIDKKLDGKKEVTVDIPTDKPATYSYACGMDMFHGRVVVK
ncbi:cupredoxin domain-containing protein [Limosilactobacillus sp. BG-MG3-A]|uniref:Cupredoxin domain-containing protein n=1 Tax=Limosilactobacillus agrestis TaxID=2759748 RepID=A0A7W3YLA5_9LACO|nr:cupredoxin domain-containing protein [Limosilactobacillus agrestis]MBB1095042.1 cupredoxin domain-containing protein [Limosilactobacillus agrestis]